MNEYVITLDVDWAPDVVIDYVAEKFISKNVKATWFITHDSPSIRNLFKYSDLFEIGLHPNFMSGSIQGNTPEQVMEYLKNIYPGAETVRTHGLVQSAQLLKLMRDKYGIKYDSSIFLAYTPYIQPHSIYYPGSDELVRLPFFWGDYHEAYIKTKDFSFSNLKYHVQGMKIFNFHPIHIALNTYEPENYMKLKSEYKIQQCTQSVINKYRNENNEGTINIFHGVLDMNTKQNGGKLLREIGEEWRKSHN